MSRSLRKPLFHPLAAKCFETVFLPLRKFHLGEIRFLNLPEVLPEDRPILLVGNHVSNWDGFVFRELQTRLRPAWPIYSVMLEKELRRLPIFRLLGGVGIDPGSPASVTGAIRALGSLRRKSPEFFLSYFPQGSIYPSFKRPLDFKGGVDLFIRALTPLTVLPVGLHIEPMRKLAPTFFASVGRPIKMDDATSSFQELENLVQSEIDRLHQGLCRQGENYSKLAPQVAIGSQA